MRKFSLLLIAAIYLFIPTLRADEGMWLPSLIGSRIADMRAKGFKLSAEDIYSINQASLKDAIVQFGGGCTAEIISDEGLLLTNHHCGYGQIQAHSSVQNDLLTNGFWAMNRKEELPNPGLSVSFLVCMDDVTKQVLAGVTESMSQAERDKVIAENSAKIRENATKDSGYKASVEPFYYGNQYFLFVYEHYNDVRLVGAPPSSVGKFGGDTDNWMWPRHTGDFAMFRIYADKNNKPASYSKDNVPYKPKRSLTISTKGLKEGDFTFVYGFPGRTNQYITSDAVDYILNKSNPHKIALRTMRLDVMNEEQAKDIATRIQYAAKNAGVANAWKKWQGESKGIARLGTIAKKEALEKQFTIWAASRSEYSTVLPRLKQLYAELSPYSFARDYYSEAYGAIELPRFALQMEKAIENPELAKATATEFYKNYSPLIDSRTAKAVLAAYQKNVPHEFQPELFTQAIEYFGNINDGVDMLFKESNFASAEHFKALLNMPADIQEEAIQNDPAILIGKAFNELNSNKISGKYNSLNREITTLYRVYMKGLMEMQKDKIFFPDANSTLRVAYGHMEGYKPFDAVYYTPQTTIEGIMEKDNPEIYDYDVPQKLREIYAKKDYGRWDVSGTVPVAFLATNHTTGGNSGSPVLNGNGELVGINFDRTWESTMSDVEFDPIKCRNIAVDIRYVLFLMDKVGGAGYLLNEMKFAK